MPRDVPQIFDTRRRALRHARARAAHRRGDAAAFLHADMVEDVLASLDFMQKSDGHAFVLGDVTDTLAPALEGRGFAVRQAGLDTFDDEAPFERGDFDLLALISTLDTVNDLPGALIHARAALAPGGILMAQMPGAGSLPSLRKIMLTADGDAPAARLHPQVDSRSAAALLQRAGFSRQVVDSRSLDVRYSYFGQLIRDLRDQALTGVLSDRPPALTRMSIDRARTAFDSLREDDGKVTERFEILALTGWR